MALCPCGSSIDFDQCCARFITAAELPQTPEQLMRSRYTAYTQANIDYIVKTMKAPANIDFDPVEAKSWAKDVKWLGLEVANTSQTVMKAPLNLSRNIHMHRKNMCCMKLVNFAVKTSNGITLMVMVHNRNPSYISPKKLRATTLALVAARKNIKNVAETRLNDVKQARVRSHQTGSCSS
jgi:uncharacterized protein YchJ